MDPLDRLAGPATDLLGRVDELLTNGGAPADHRIWPLLRRLRTLPGDAVASVAALQAAPLAAAGAAVRALIPGYDEAGSLVNRAVAWEGAAASAFTTHRDSLAAHLGGEAGRDGEPGNGPIGNSESLAGRLAQTAGYADAVAGWIDRTRLDLARTLAEALGCAEAVVVVAERVAEPTTTGGRAAADIGARVLATVAAAYDEAESLPQRWATAQDELVYGPPTGADSGPNGTTRVAL